MRSERPSGDSERFLCPAFGRQEVRPAGVEVDEHRALAAWKELDGHLVRLDQLVAVGDDVARLERAPRQHLQEILWQRVDARAARERRQPSRLFGRRLLQGEIGLRLKAVGTQRTPR